MNPFRFSSEFHDDELGLVYYNYRYYNPQLGRWTKRDPIGEIGSANLYASDNNNINTYDLLGLIIVTYRTNLSRNGVSGKYGGFIVEPTRRQTRCCHEGFLGQIVLVQYKKSKGKWVLDGAPNAMRRGENNSWFTYAYIDSSNEEGEGRPLDPRNPYRGYIDVPGIRGLGTPIPDYSQDFRVESFCRCAAGDFYLKEAVEFNFSRPGTRNMNGRLAPVPVNNRDGSPTVYPNYKNN